MPVKQRVRATGGGSIDFDGTLLVAAQALNHDDTPRRVFRVYACEPQAGDPPAGERTFVAERIDYPNTIDVRYWGSHCKDNLALYDFFGNEPLANYLYGQLGLKVPGMHSLMETP